MSSVAVEVVRACKYYGSKNDRIHVLDHLDLTIHRGTIYALLGSSGCGKTTLLNCLVGNKILNSGAIRIFEKESSGTAPGISVGYMPQHNALYQELTIKETMKYFGWLAGMTTEQIKKKLQVLKEFLQVQNVDVQVKFLSGGEQRRVSFGIVLLYDPELLILDEPTVGLDSLLRESVWTHLRELARKFGRTILLTTHYTEETKQADKIGLMRHGYVIAEAPPTTLLSLFQTGSLEDAILQLSIRQNATTGTQRFALTIPDDCVYTKCDNVARRHDDATSKRKIFALIWKQFVVLFRNIPLLIFTVMSVAGSITFFFLGVGHAPTGVSVAVVNYEANGSTCEWGCDTAQLGCNYAHLLRDKFWYVYEYHNESEAEISLSEGRIHAYVVFDKNYTAAFKKRLENLRETELWDLNHSTLRVYQDAFVKDISYYLKKSLIEVYNEFVDAYLRGCNKSSQYTTVPIDWKTPVHGSWDIEMTSNGGPSFMLMVAFCIASIVTSCSILVERNEGTFDRVMAMGVGHVEILISHVISDLGLIIFQLVCSLLVAFVFFGVSVKGSLLLAVTLALVNSFSGMCCGYAISSLMNSESAAMHLISGSMTAAVLLSGVFWPREGMHPALQAAAWFLPITQTADAMKNIVHRGWSLTKPPVYYGFLNGVMWAFVFLFGSVIIMRIKQK